MKILFLFLWFPVLAFAAPNAVVFDFGGVMAHPDREVVVRFLSETLHIPPEELERVHNEKQAGQSEVDFWLSYASQNGICLPADWPSQYRATLKEAIGANPNMYALVDELKKEGVRVALLSNIEERYGKVIRAYGFYAPFDPVLLSYEIGVDKPDPKAYRILLRALNLPASEVVFIDDKPENVEAAQKFAIDTIQFQSASQVRCALEARGLLKKNEGSYSKMPSFLSYWLQDGYTPQPRDG